MLFMLTLEPVVSARMIIEEPFDALITPPADKVKISLTDRLQYASVERLQATPLAWSSTNEKPVERAWKVT